MFTLPADRLLILRELAWFKWLDPISKARLGSGVSVLEMRAGEILYQRDEPKEYIYFLIEGCICESDDLNLLQLDADRRNLWDLSRQSNDLKIYQGFISSEIVDVNNETYKSTVVSAMDSRLLKIELEIFFETMKKVPGFKEKILVSIVSRNQEIFDQTEDTLQGVQNVEDGTWKCWLLAIVLPLTACALISQTSSDMNSDQIVFIGIVVAALTLWVTEIVPLFAPALLILSGLALMSIAPTDIVLSGFSSQTFLFMIGLYTIGSLIKESGLAYRTCLLMLSYIPPRQNYISSALFTIGLLLNPILPSATARSNIVSPLLSDIKKNLKVLDQSDLYSGLALSAYAGITSFSFVFLTAKSENLILYALLPTQTRDAYGYVSWFLSSLLIAIPLLMIMIVIWRIRFGKCKFSKVTKEKIDDQLNLLGNLTNFEVQAILSILIFVIGSITSAFHGISMAWISILLLCYLLFSKVISSSKFKSFIDWQFLLFLAAIIGLSNSIPYSGLDTALMHSLSGLEAIVESNMYLFAVILMILIYCLRFILPPKLCAPLLATVFIPIFQNENINPWYFCIICLVLCDSAFLPYQHATLANFLSEINSNTTLNKKTFYQTNALINCCKIFAIIIAISIWHALGTL